MSESSPAKLSPRSTPTTHPPATLLIETAGNLDAHRIESDSTIGRDRRCGIVLDHPTVSRTHARIYREGERWLFEDLGSQNGSMVGESRTRATSRLREGAELRIGRVRAWFFADAVPSGWAPADAPRLAGKLIRCVCGNIGWAPIHNDLHLRCNACGREITRRDPDAPVATILPTPQPPAIASPASPTIVDCAACHTAITGSETLHECTECGATMHLDCWTENRGCATYGCTQVGVLDRTEDDSPAATHDESPDAATPIVASDRWRRMFDVALSDTFKQSLMAVIAFAGSGLPFFGIPPIGYAAYQLVGVDPALEGNRRFVWAGISFAAGVVGFACSARWWLGIH